MHPAGPEDLVRAARRVGVFDERVLAALRTTMREAFLPLEDLRAVYDDAPLAIGHGQVTTQPSLSARMLEGLALTGGEHVLEIGTGAGFQTALLARLAGDVVSIEWWPDLSEQAGRVLATEGVDNVELVVGDGRRGVPERAPFDAVLVSAAALEVPVPLVEQLRWGGRLVQPIGAGGNERVMLFERTESGLRRIDVLALARFVRMRGRA
ncbi:protein-L-isoaspartate O-methyltransferase [Saccharopolyspora phatthalungensis]|uniref:Protein-L-isoaspartate O-methyltransferase n=1 Tax=Saccharopolyspora phatthalungensis TaxID=664693 RepID=A0A840QHL9_9PSEU|nr:protein-L-isoaspartate O-methyltransferase [Saccharopolyspora phatthalungensis]MBB5158278.1 protein-L-isoaspartate(D-aspartate) O-methyltransferase [Saccharopolyspora phatthalungensis]